MIQTILNERRRLLGITAQALARISGVPIATVNRILENPSSVQFRSVAAVSRVLGVDLESATCVPVENVLQCRARVKAQYVAKIVQGTQGLEAAAVDSLGHDRIVEVAERTLLAGNKRKLWDED